MASHPLKRNNTPRHANQQAAYDSLSHSDNNPPSNEDYHGNDADSNDYSNELSGGYKSDGYDEYGDLNSEAEEYYNSGASKLVTTVR